VFVWDFTVAAKGRPTDFGDCGLFFTVTVRGRPVNQEKEKEWVKERGGGREHAIGNNERKKMGE
jgi:hypothetical protein